MIKELRRFATITGSEILRMFARKRTYIGYAVFTAFNLLFGYLFSRPGPQKFFRRPLERSGYPFEEYFSALTLGFLILAVSTVFLAVIFFSLVGGDIVAKESEDGNLRLILSRPVSRLKLLLSKFLACQFYTVTLVIFIGVLSYITGSFLARWNGGLFAFAPERNLFAVFEFGEGLRRYGLAILLLSLSMTTISSMGFLFSCQRMKPAAATILTIGVFFIDTILAQIPYFQDYKQWFLSTHLGSWINAFRQPIPWPDAVMDYAYLMGISATCFIIGWLTFERRDLKA